MTQNRGVTAGLKLLYLARAVLKQQTLIEASDILTDLEDLEKVAEFHGMLGMAAQGLLRTGGFQGLPEEVQKHWKKKAAQAQMRQLCIEEESRTLLDFLEEQGIFHMSLKGAVLKDYYPGYGLRQMSDWDILYDGDYAATIRDYMVSRGYRVDFFGKTEQDVYFKPPYFYFEFHRNLFSEDYREDWNEYCRGHRDRLVLEEGKKARYHFTREDFYLYFVAHAQKHYHNGGTGLRTLMDAYVFLEKFGDSLDWTYVQEELKKLDLGEFEVLLRSLSLGVFTGEKAWPFMEEEIFGALSLKEQESFLYFLESGSYGTKKHYVKSRLKEQQNPRKEEEISKKTRWTYLFWRLFPGRLWYEKYIPFCRRHPWSIPFYAVYRIVRGILFSGKQILEEIRYVNKE